MSYRLRCRLCPAEWTGERIEDCRTCGAEQVSYTELVPRDETVRLAEIIEWLCGPDSFVPTDGTAAATRRRIADALLARFGAGQAEDER